jgi:hypothetical protein
MGAGLKPHVLLIEPMMPEVEAQIDAAYCVHRRFAAHDRAALIAAIAPLCAPSLPAVGTALEVREKTQRRREMDSH